MGRRATQFEGRLGRHRFHICHSPNAVGAEDFLWLRHHSKSHWVLIFVRSMSLIKTHSSFIPKAKVANLSGNFSRFAVRWIMPPQSLYSPFMISPHLLPVPLIGVR